MLDILLSQLGIKPDELKAMAKAVTENVERVDMRLARIEEKLGIEAEAKDDNAS